MPWPVVWMPLARQQAGAAHLWWLEHRPAAPLLFRHELVHAVALLAEQPRLGAAVRDRDARRLVLPRTGYLLFYRLRPRAQRVEVVAIKHGRRRPPLL